MRTSAFVYAKPKVQISCVDPDLYGGISLPKFLGNCRKYKCKKYKKLQFVETFSDFVLRQLHCSSYQSHGR